MLVESRTLPTEPDALFPVIASVFVSETLPTAVVDALPEIEIKTTGDCVPTAPVDALPVTVTVTGPPPPPTPTKELNGASENAEIPNINHTAVSCRVPLGQTDQASA